MRANALTRRLSRLAAAAALAGIALGATAAQAADPVPAGRVYTAAGWIAPHTAYERSTPPGALATSAYLDLPSAMLELADGSLLVATGYHGRIHRVGPSGTISRFAGGPGPTGAEGGPATRAGFQRLSALAQLPDGSILVADELADLVRRIRPDGTIHTVAGLRDAGGSGGTIGFSGDGGPATSARLALPMALAVLPDGSFLIADSDNNRVRRVAADGTITTVAGNGRARPSGDGGPATRAGVPNPVALAVQPDGGFLIGEGGDLDLATLEQGAGGVRRVAPDGTITTLKRLRVRSLVATDNGGFLAVRGGEFDDPAEQIVRVDGRGRVRVVAGGRPLRNLWGAWVEFRPPFLNGVPPLAAQVYTTHLAAARDGGVYFNDLARVRYWAPAQPRRLAIGLDRRTLTSPLALRAHVHLTRPATVVAQARRNGRVVRRVSVHLRAGEQAIALGDPVPPGRYELTVTAASTRATPQRAGDAVVVLPGGVLTLDAARGEATRFVRQGMVFDPPAPARTATVTTCRRLGEARARCLVKPAKRHCRASVDVILRHDGSVVAGPIGSCAK